MAEWGLEPPDVGAAPEDDPGMPVQLGLFSPDRQEVEAGFAALGRLELERAETLLRGLLERDPCSDDGREGLEAVAHWRTVLEAVATLPAVERAHALWRAVSGCPPRLLTRSLRARLLEDVLETLETQAAPLPCPELCAADVLLALGRERTARSWLEWAVRHEPRAARLQLLLGDACWMTASAGPARSAYSRGLLLDPTLERWRDVVWIELRRKIRSAGGDRTALELWAAGGLPLPPPDAAGPAHPLVAEVWAAMAAAHEAAARHRHDEAVRHRMRLRELDPEIFKRYMARLEG